MELALITAKQVIVLFFLILTGIVVVKTGVLQLESKKMLSNLLVQLVVPAMVLNSYMMEFDPKIVGNLGKALGYSTLFLMLGIVITFIITALIPGIGRNLPILRFGTMFSNAAYMGFPLIQAIFGDEGLMYASVYVTVFNVLLWTIGYAVVSGQPDMKKVAKVVMTNPVLYAVVLGLVIYLGRIPVPSVIQSPLAYIGNMNTPISMLITGMLIAGVTDWKKLFNRQNGLALFLRMVVTPACCLGLCYLFSLHGIVVAVALLLEACPCAAITSVFAVQFGHDEDLAAGMVVCSTVLSIITLPVMAFLLPGV